MELKKFDEPSIKLLKLDALDIITVSDEDAGEEDEF